MDIPNVLFNALGSAVPSVLIIIKPFIVIILGYLIVKILIISYKQRQLNKAGMSGIAKMTGTQFETYLGNMFTKLGYRVTPTGGLEDMGCDLIIEKEGVKTAVQAKRWKNQVKTEAVQEIVAAMKPYNCTKSLIVTNSTFTWRTERLASKNNVELWDKYRLAREIEKARN